MVMMDKMTNRKDKIIVVGGGGHSKVIINILKKLDQYEILGYTDLENNGEIDSIKYLGTDEIIFEKHPPTMVNLVIGLGILKPEPGRLEITKRFIDKEYQFPPIISPGAICNSHFPPGQATVVMDGTVVNPGVKIGAAVILNTNSTVEHDCIISDNVHIAPGAILSGNVSVGANTMIGAGATVIQDIIIGDNILVGAGSVITNNLLEPGVYFGVPAKKVR